jgi:acyl-CoA reductase-like NAD-dependent aldehyde dehydrogenase
MMLSYRTGAGGREREHLHRAGQRVLRRQDTPARERNTHQRLEGGRRALLRFPVAQADLAESWLGGFKQSGFSRDKSIHAIEKYTDLKTAWISLG